MNFQGFDGSVHVYSPEAAEGYLQSWGLWGPRWQSAERETCSVWNRLWWIKYTHTHKMNINIALGAVQLLRGRIDTDNAHVWWEILFIMKNTEDKLSHAWETRDTLRTGSSVECVWDGRWWAVVLTWRGGGVAASLSGGGGRFGVWQGQGHGSRHRGRRRRRQHGGGQERVVKLPLTTPVGLDRKRTEKTWKQTPSINGTLDTYDQQAQQKYHTRARQENVLSNFLLLIAIKKIYDPKCSLSLLRPSGPQQFGQS